MGITSLCSDANNLAEPYAKVFTSSTYPQPGLTNHHETNQDHHD